MKGFYVFNVGGGPPSFIHEDSTRARLEAERLARTHPGQRFQVLAIVAECAKSDVTWSDGWVAPDEDTPF